MSYFGHTNIFLNPNPDYNIYFVKTLLKIVELLNVRKHVIKKLVRELYANGQKALLMTHFIKKSLG